MQKFFAEWKMIRLLIMIAFGLLLLTVQRAEAQQSPHQASPLVCFTVEGVARVLDNMVEPTQIGSLGNLASTDVIPRVTDCDFNYRIQSKFEYNVVWLFAGKWLVKLEIVDAGNQIYLWRPAEIYERDRFALPRGCRRHFFTENVQGVAPMEFYTQSEVLPRYCLDPVRR
jgi:hypothetical protein